MINDFCLCGCGKKLRGMQTKYASDKCRTKQFNVIHLDYMKDYKKEHYVEKHKNCPCGKELTGSQRKYCCDKHNNKYRSTDGKPFIPRSDLVTCLLCGLVVPRTHGNQQYCCRAHQIKHEVKERQSLKISGTKPHICPACGRHYKGDAAYSLWSYCPEHEYLRERSEYGRESRVVGGYRDVIFG